MEKTLLIPVDFHVESLNTLKFALKEAGNDTVNVILLYAEALSSSISELLFYSPQKILQSRMKPEFEEGLSILRNRFETTIRSLHIELFHGYTLRALQHLLEAKEVTLICIPENYSLKVNKSGLDPVRLLQRSKIPVQKIAWIPQAYTSEKDQLNALFNA